VGKAGINPLRSFANAVAGMSDCFGLSHAGTTAADTNRPFPDLLIRVSDRFKSSADWVTGDGTERTFGVGRRRGVIDPKATFNHYYSNVCFLDDWVEHQLPNRRR
jgi:hypothetical protein